MLTRFATRTIFVADTNWVSWTQKNVSESLQKHFLCWRGAQQGCRVLPRTGNIVGHSVSATVCPHLLGPHAYLRPILWEWRYVYNLTFSNRILSFQECTLCIFSCSRPCTRACSIWSDWTFRPWGEYSNQSEYLISTANASPAPALQTLLWTRTLHFHRRPGGKWNTEFLLPGKKWHSTACTRRLLSGKRFEDKGLLGRAKIWWQGKGGSITPPPPPLSPLSPPPPPHTHTHTHSPPNPAVPTRALSSTTTLIPSISVGANTSPLHSPSHLFPLHHFQDTTFSYGKGLTQTILKEMSMCFNLWLRCTCERYIGLAFNLKTNFPRNYSRQMRELKR